MISMTTVLVKEKWKLCW